MLFESISFVGRKDRNKTYRLKFSESTQTKSYTGKTNVRYGEIDGRCEVRKRFWGSNLGKKGVLLIELGPK
jgi:hypothetical protein